LQRWYEILRTILVSRFIEVAKSGHLAPAKYWFEAVGLYPPTAETLAKPENSLAYVVEANGFADGSGKLRERSNGFDDKRSETSNAGGKRGGSRFRWRKRKGINSWTNARGKAKARREDAEDTVE
jgi:hypothetical protein